MDKMKEKITSGKMTDVTCPECGRMIWEQDVEGPVQYSCHVGHTYSAGVMRQAKTETAEATVWNAIRSLEEKDAILIRDL